MKNVFKAITILAAVLVAFLLFLDISFFIQGSLEMFPTPEQIDKGRTVYGLLILPLTTIEVFLVFIVFKLFRKR